MNISEITCDITGLQEDYADMKLVWYDKLDPHYKIKYFKDFMLVTKGSPFRQLPKRVKDGFSKSSKSLVKLFLVEGVNLVMTGFLAPDVISNHSDYHHEIMDLQNFKEVFRRLGVSGYEEARSYLSLANKNPRYADYCEQQVLNANEIFPFIKHMQKWTEEGVSTEGN